MWTYDINKEIWSPVSYKSSVVPSPRSEFSHSRYQDDFIIFGGAGDGELYNDIYRYSTKDRVWKLIPVDSTSKPSARRAACMAVADDFIFIYGGFEASGYSNELWKFEWGTQSFTLLDSNNSPPKSAFSQCHIETNSENQMIFKVYMGETSGEIPVSFIYEYNIATNTWIKILWEGYIPRSKGTIFMINDNLIIAGGREWNYSSYRDIIIHNMKSNHIYSDNLPIYNYFGASAYYKNKIYIHGGGYSFGYLPLQSIVKNDLIVINLNENCEGSNDVCISDCSKGTYFNNGDCNLCPKGSYSNKLGSTSCDMCSAGYFSDIIGAETSKACKPCPNGYFNTQEGQSFCLKCPSDSICSLDEARPENSSDLTSNVSIQPSLLDYQSDIVEDNSKIFYIIISMTLLLCMPFVLTYKNAHKLLSSIDIYSKHHNYKQGRPMKLKKTLIGGIFTIIFVFSSLGIIFNIFLAYSIDNIRETKALVPLAAIEQQYDSVISI
jgi:hypothetical protein